MATRKSPADAVARPTKQTTAARVRIVRAQPAGSGRALKTPDGVEITKSRTLRLGGTGRDGSGAAEVPIADDEVVRVEYDNGLALWMRADDLFDERGKATASRSGSTGETVWQIDTGPRLNTFRSDGPAKADRGALSLGIKLLEVFGINLAGKTAGEFGKRFELHRLQLPDGTEPGLFRIDLTGQKPATQVPADQAASLSPANQPLLVFLHGTMSSFGGSFKALVGGIGDAPADDVALGLRSELVKRYRDRTLAFEHRTLTESPIFNALNLVRNLPERAELHLVSHSRGGLVGELLCLGQRNKTDDPLTSDLLARLFGVNDSAGKAKTDQTLGEALGLGKLTGSSADEHRKAYAEDLAHLKNLLEELDKKKIRVTRFVRVACPARGTTLASGRLDRWLSVLNALVAKVNPIGLIDDAADFMLAVIKKRTDPRTLPGLEAMMPGSALTRLLHLPGLVTQADLTAIAGDVQGKGLWGQLKLLALDWFYAGDHDLVVNTGSMLGGIRREGGTGRFQKDEGDQVNHFRYFSNRTSVGWLSDGLLRADGSSAGFLPIEKAPRQDPASRGARGAGQRRGSESGTPKPLAVVIPGTMGSALTAAGREVWLEYWPLMKGGLGDIAITKRDVKAVDLLEDFYGPLIEHLRRTHRVEIVPYDWRLSVQEAARRLARELENLLPQQVQQRQPVHLVAHSMGGLVARSMMGDSIGGGAALWQQIKRLQGSRLLMLGTPNLGSYEAVRWLVGQNPTQVKLALLDFTRSTDGVIEIVRGYPGLAELLPFDAESSKWSKAETWKDLKAQLGADWSPIDDSVLRLASGTWDRLKQTPPEPEHMIYVAGCQPATVIGCELMDPAQTRGRPRLQWKATREGDGTVTWASGRLANVPMYYAPDTAHDDLCANTDNRSIFRGYVDLLLTGKTDQLPTTPPATRAAAGEPNIFALPLQPVADDLPDEDAVRSLGFGGSRRRRSAGSLLGTQLQVSIRHGDLRYARHPVLVGHYAGDTIVSAERALDDQMRGDQRQGPLTRQRDLGLYPGPHGSHAVFFNEQADRKPAGAVVVGLGTVGELSPSRLEANVRDALLEYAVRLLQRQALQPNAARASASVTCLLVGTGAASLTARESLEALLRAALAANRKLEETELDPRVLIDRIEFLELFEDVAIGAARELAKLLDMDEFADRIDWPERELIAGEGGLQRSSPMPDQTWWQRLEITEDRQADRLKFVATTDRARAEETLAAGQLLLADGFITEAIGSADAMTEVSKTLFEMLFPNRMKESTPDQRSTVYLLDEAAARFPWELLEDRWSHLGRPPAVTSGLVRQLKSAEFRSQPVHATDRSIFVVGNPALGGWKAFPDLKGAREEAKGVMAVFRQHGFDVIGAIDAPASEILNGLHSQPWKVLHLAGHGEHRYGIDEAADTPRIGIDALPGSREVPLGGAGAATLDQPAAPAMPEPIQLPDGSLAQRLPRRKIVSGMIIGKEVFLTPGDVEQMRHVPELVFVNCCHLGKTGGGSAQHNRLAANLGVQFIRMGVRAVICAGWLVDDDAALTFAKTFYGAMLVGEPFGEAVRSAREAAWQAFPQVNTWGAYQCYGDPSYRLVRDGDEFRQRPVPADFVSPRELVVELRNLTERTRMEAKTSHKDEAAAEAELRQRTEALKQRIPEPLRNADKGWLGRADVAAALGFAYGEGRLLPEAVEWLNRALAAKRGDCPVRAAEQCANFKIRQAQKQWTGHLAAGVAMDDPKLRGEIAKALSDAVVELEAINTRGPTAERMSLMGSGCKRVAWIESGARRSKALMDMAGHYRKAWEFKDARSDAYPFSNWAVACLLLGSMDPSKTQRSHWLAELAELTARQLELVRAEAERQPNFWNDSSIADLMLVQMLIKPDGAQAAAPAVLNSYRNAIARGGSQREVGSLQEHLDFLLALTQDTAANGQPAWKPPLREALQLIRDGL